MLSAAIRPPLEHTRRSVLDDAAPPVTISDTAIVGARRAKRIPELDGIRGLAIGLVVLFHYIDVAIPLGARSIHGSAALFYLWLPTRLMWAGIDLFFVLSGVLIGGILLDNRSSPRYYSTFYARRIHRIFPLYYFVIVVITIGASLWPESPLFYGT